MPQVTEATTRGGYAALDPCVHCGFCLPACPTYLATGDENDSPRGRIVLMRALEAGELPPTDPSLRHHLDACLGCRGCEPVCPSGVGYGRALESARADIAAATGLPWPVRAGLMVFRHEALWRPALTAARWFSATGIPARLAGWGRVGFGMGMVSGGQGGRGAAGRGGGAAAGQRGSRAARHELKGAQQDAFGPAAPRPPCPPTARIALFRGCVMDTLFRDVNTLTRQVLEACGHTVVEVADQGCCGALHAHAGARDDARALALRNIAAFEAVDADCIVVNSAGCGALLREYEHLVDDPRAAGVAAKIRDITEILAESTLPPMRELDLELAYDPPCHLQHAQRVHDAPLAVLGAMPGVRVRMLPGADRCCGAAGLYGVLHPGLSHQILREKIATIRAAVPRPTALVTGNPGCLMQFRAGLRAEGIDLPVLHPVEVVGAALGFAQGWVGLGARG